MITVPHACVLRKTRQRIFTKIVNFSTFWFITFWFIPSIRFNSTFLLKAFRDFTTAACFSVCFLTVFPKGEYANLAYSVISLWLEDNISSPVRYSYLSILPDDNANIFAASLLISFVVFHL